MRALRFHAFGDLSNLRVEELPTPAPGSDEVLVKVHAASINPSDAKNVLGRFPQTKLPRTPGRDLAGVIVAGERERIGEEVWAAGGDIGTTRDGSHAEYILLPGKGARPKPKRLSMADAASAGINYITAYSALVAKAQLKEGETVLLTGISGGVGSSAARIAKLNSARVIGVDRRPSPSGQADVDLLISSETDDIAARVREFTQGKGVNLALDAVGGPLFETVLNTLALDGRQVCIVSVGTSRVSFNLPDFYHRRLTLYGLDTMGFDTIACGEVLDEVAPLFDQGKLTPPRIARTVSLDQAIEAYKDVDSGKVKGKLVIVFPD
jgi:NADPH:quinone reductase